MNTSSCKRNLFEKAGSEHVTSLTAQEHVRIELQLW